MIDKLKVEFVIRFKNVTDVSWIKNMLREYIVLETSDRLIIDVPMDWQGFRDGTIIRILSELNEAVYVALAYITENEKVIVTDFEGGEVDRFQEVIDGRLCSKYVKKKLRVLEILNEEEQIFSVKGYMLDLEYPEPVVKVLDVYSVGKESGLRIDSFIKK